jgi:selenide,water dikinase
MDRDVQLKIDMDRIPVMSEALDMYERGMNTGVNPYNKERVEKNMLFEKIQPGWSQEIVFDPQTSGGLLAAVPEDQGKTLREALQHKGLVQAEIIGRVETLNSKDLLFFH